MKNFSLWLEKRLYLPFCVLFFVVYIFAGILSYITLPLVYDILKPLGLKLYYKLTTKHYRYRRYKKWLRVRNIQTFKGRHGDGMFAPVCTDLVRRRPMPQTYTYNTWVHEEYLEDINPLKWVILVFSIPGKIIESFP
jgi:hypothetical protein